MSDIEVLFGTPVPMTFEVAGIGSFVLNRTLLRTVAEWRGKYRPLEKQSRALRVEASLLSLQITGLVDAIRTERAAPTETNASETTDAAPAADAAIDDGFIAEFRKRQDVIETKIEENEELQAMALAERCAFLYVSTDLTVSGAAVAPTAEWFAATFSPGHLQQFVEAAEVAYQGPLLMKPSIAA